MAWVATLGPKESAMLDHVVGWSRSTGGAEALNEAAEFVARYANQQTSKTRAKAAREIVGVLLRVKRSYETAIERFTTAPSSPRVVQ